MAGLCFVAWLASVPALADGFDGNPERIAAIVSGALTEEGQLLLGVECGPAVTQALRVYSEPSHTPVAFAVALGFAETEAGQAWRAGWEGEPLLLAELADLTQGGFEQAFERPHGDTRIEVWARSLWPDGTEEERLVSEVDIGSDGFLFFSAPGDAGGLDTHCCALADGAEACVTCAGPAFACTPEPVCEAP